MKDNWGTIDFGKECSHAIQFWFEVQPRKWPAQHSKIKRAHRCGHYPTLFRHCVMVRYQSEH